MGRPWRILDDSPRRSPSTASPEMIESGKAGFVLTVLSLLVVVFSFGAMAWFGVSDDVLPIIFVALATAGVGHFFLGGREFRKKMLDDRKKSRKK